MRCRRSWPTLNLPRWVVRLAQTARRYRTTTSAPGRFCIRTRGRTRTSCCRRTTTTDVPLEPTFGDEFSRLASSPEMPRDFVDEEPTPAQARRSLTAVTPKTHSECWMPPLKRQRPLLLVQ